MPETPIVPDVHLIERVKVPAEVYRQICGRSGEMCVIVDLTSGRVDNPSRLEAERRTAPPGQTWLAASEFAPDIADSSLREYVRWLSDVGDQELLDGKSIKQWFTYNGDVSLWWMTMSTEKGQISSPYRWLFYAFAMIDLALRRGQVQPGATWHLWVPDEPTGRVLGDYVGDRGEVVLHPSDPVRGERTWQRLSDSVLNPLLRVMHGLRLAAHTRRERATGFQAVLRADYPRILVATEYPRSWRATTDAERVHDAVHAFDFYLGSLPWDLREAGMEAAWVRAAPSIADYERWKREGVGRQDLPDATAWATIGLSAARNLLVHQFRWCRDFRRLFSRERAQRRLRYREIEMGYWIVRDYAQLCRGAAVAAMLKVEQFRRAAEALEPSAVVYRDEVYHSGRQLTAGMSRRTRLIGIQHGIIHREMTFYCFDSRDVPDGPDGKDHVRYCPMPDVFATFGEYVRELFRHWDGYAPERVVPVGGARHDILVRHLTAPPELEPDLVSRLRSRLGLPHRKLVVLLCTQYSGEAGRWFDLVCQGLDASGIDAVVAVKTHHYHGGEENIHAVAAKRSFENYRLFAGDTYPLIACADVVVSGPSTIILEAYLLATPAISIAGSDGYELYPYAAEAIGELVSSPATMADALRSTLQGGAGTADRFRRQRSTVCERHLWNHDAKGGARIAALVSSLISRPPG
jgi:hypothetical protein